MSRVQKSVAKWVGAFLLSFCSFSYSNAQIQIPGTDFTLSPVNNGTGGLVSVPIPGGAGLSVTVGTGSAALPLQEIKNNPNAVNITTWDDWYNEVPLGFNFPFYGQNFTTSWAMTNGLVTFQNPQTSGLGGACCEGVDLRTTTNSRYNYTIYGMHTDLYSWNGQNQYYLRGNNEMTYGWYNLSQCCSSNGGNSFEIKINSSGLVDTRIAGAMVSWNRVTSGMAGDLSKGEYFQAYHGQGINITPGSANIFSWQALGGTGAVDQCVTNPLFNPSCPGYATAYFNQQCSISALYNSSCPGYANAYFTQQCTLNSLYNVNCPGYAQAYYNYQCSVNPLYHTGCDGYQQAYFNQQCSLNSLYSTNCPGYAQAYFSQQCSLNSLYSTQCPNYAQAYFNQQCMLNSLYDTQCPGYQQAYFNQQCTLNGLYSTQCPNYAQAFFNQQCSLNGLYNTQCPNYAEAYATKQALDASKATTNPSTSIAAPVVVTNTSEPSRPAVVADPVVNSVVTSTATSTSPAQAATATVPLVQSNTTTSSTSVTTAAVVREEKKQEEKTDAASTSTTSSSNNQTASSQESKPSGDQPKSARQELQERRVAAARAQAVEAGKNLAENVGKAASIEQQIAVQNVVVAAMGFVPGFDTYNRTIIPDGVGYRPFTIYNNQRNIDNPAGRRFMTGSDRLHTEMVDAQYNR